MLLIPLAACGDGTGALEGFVRLAGESLPAPTSVQNTTDPETCGREQSLEDLLVSAEARGVQNVIATFVDIPEDRVPAGSPQRLVIDNQDCRFIPHVSVAALGDTMVAINSDRVVHTTHYYGPLNDNVALPPSGERVGSVVSQLGIITVLCDLHGWMRAFIRVDSHRFHAVSDELGFLRIEGIPPGDYTLELWHERLGTQQVQVEIRPDETIRLDIEYALPPSRP